MTTVEERIIEQMNSRRDVPLPTKFEVCPTCQGRGQHSQNLGAFTADEMHELGDDFREDYIAGHYDSKCETCDGQRVVSVLDRERTGALDLKLFDGELREEWELQQMERQERMMGA